MKEETKQLLDAIREKPSVFEFDVIDNSMLKGKLRKRKTLVFTFKPPTLEKLTKIAEPLLKLPYEVLKGENNDPNEMLRFTDEMAEITAILAHNKPTPIPTWYKPFFLKNLTGKELFLFFKEMTVKMQTGFFLNSSQIARANPLINLNQNDSIHINLSEQ